jgi:hypothetical protein
MAFNKYLDSVAHADSAQRDSVIQQIQTRSQAERRKGQVR